MNIIILDNKPYIRYRVKELVEKGDTFVHEASNSTQLFSKLNELNNNVNLLILEINLKDEDGIEVIKKLKKRNIDIPFMVLTAVNTRDGFIRAVKEGTIDYFIKPFDDKIFCDRVIRHAKGDRSIEPPKNSREHKEIIQSKDYLEEEIQKAKDGNYRVALVMYIVYKSLKDLTLDIENDNMIIMDNIFNKVKTKVIDTTKVIRYGSRTFIGAYANCDEKEIINLCESASNKFEDIKKQDYILKDYYFDSVSLIYPEDGENKEDLLKKLTEKMTVNIEKKQKKL